MNLTSSKVKISTCVYISKLDTLFDLENIFNYIEINEQVLGIKYHNQFKGDIKQTGSFFNQASIKIFIKKYNKQTNLKVFSNGLFQITGVKNNYQALYTVKIFLDNIVNIEGINSRKVLLEDDIIFDKEEYESIKEYDRFNYIKIYKKINTEEYEILGKKKADFFIINDNKKVSFCKENKWFVGSVHNNFEKKIYAVNGEYIGYYKFIMKYKRKNLILHNCTYSKSEENDNIDNIINKYKNIIGERHLFLEKNKKEEETPKEINIKYNSITNKNLIEQIRSLEIYKNFSEKINLKVSNINCIFEIDLGKNLLNKTNVHYIFSEKYKVYSYYKPDSRYQAINLKLNFDNDLKIISSDEDSFINKFTVLIFQNGKIIISGCSNRLQIVEVKKFIIKVFNENYNDFIINKKEIQVNNEELFIWDLI